MLPVGTVGLSSDCLSRGRNDRREVKSASYTTYEGLLGGRSLWWVIFLAPFVLYLMDYIVLALLLVPTTPGDTIFQTRASFADGNVKVVRSVIGHVETRCPCVVG